MTAYQALGPFISTFADPNITALLHNDNGEIIITDYELLVQRLDLEKEEIIQAEINPDEQQVVVIKSDCDEEENNEEQEVIQDMDMSEEEIEETEEAKENEHLSRKIVHSKSLNDLSPEEDRAKNYQMTTSESFNNFLYWRDPLPILEELPSTDEQQQQLLNSPEHQKKGK